MWWWRTEEKFPFDFKSQILKSSLSRVCSHVFGIKNNWKKIQTTVSLMTLILLSHHVMWARSPKKWARHEAALLGRMTHVAEREGRSLRGATDFTKDGSEPQVGSFKDYLSDIRERVHCSSNTQNFFWWKRKDLECSVKINLQKSRSDSWDIWLN